MHAEVMRDLEAVKEELCRLKVDFDSVLVERTAAEKEVEELQTKTERNLRLLERLKKEIEVAKEDFFLVELGKTEALKEYKEIERQREGKRKEVLYLLVEKDKRIKEMLEEAERSKDIENELFETTSDVEMLQTQLNLVKKMERRDNSMSRSNRSFGRGKSVLKEVTEAKKEELASVNAELFRLMTIMDALRKENLKAKEETARLNKVLREDDAMIQKLNSKMIMVKSRLELALSSKERVSSLADSLAGSFEKLKKNKEAAKKEERLLEEEKTVTKAETEKTRLEIDEKERELISKLDELEKVKQAEALVLDKLEALIEDTMERRETESKHCSTITISRFEYEYLSRHASQAEETAEKKVEAAEAWIKALKVSTKAILMKNETLMRESGVTRVEEEREAFRTQRSLSTKQLVEGEIQKFKGKPEGESYLSPKPVGKSVRLSPEFKPVQRGKPRRYSSVGTPTCFVIKKKKKVPTLVKFFSRNR
ncbi:protein PLASTID MOVEMENT IMPAIRED 15 [Eutrema salsugineum]|nr:protein PLASTID MOVEMENT IMPAIRED 15 [Eutrema salsugineum]XP_024014808.1 protein PLASTID MOVEMENT IMPAIRED 15 [Eutrema salsugineum]